jgi:hypothetical protein
MNYTPPNECFFTRTSQWANDSISRNWPHISISGSVTSSLVLDNVWIDRRVRGDRPPSLRGDENFGSSMEFSPPFVTPWTACWTRILGGDKNNRELCSRKGCTSYDFISIFHLIPPCFVERCADLFNLLLNRLSCNLLARHLPISSCNLGRAIVTPHAMRKPQTMTAN